MSQPIKWEQVRCRDCGREFQCTPWDDYYNATTADDGTCEQCLCGDLKFVHVELNADGSLTEVPRPGPVLN